MGDLSSTWGELYPEKEFLVVGDLSGTKAELCPEKEFLGGGLLGGTGDRALLGGVDGSGDFMYPAPATELNGGGGGDLSEFTGAVIEVEL